MSETSREKRPFNPRMHQGGKLSFRGRVQDGDDDPGEWLVVGGDNPPHLDELVPAAFLRRGQVEIEIGSGKGAFVLAGSQARPERFLLGIEAAPGYASLAATKLREANVQNALLLIDNGKLYLQDRVAPGDLAAVHVYFPDPWPKRRHAGRRFFTDEAPALLARAIADGGFLYFASDNACYSGQVVRVMGNSPDFVRDAEQEARVQGMGPGHAFSPTHFERKYIEEGRIIRRFAFRRRTRVS